MQTSKDANKIIILGLAESGKSTIIKTVKEGKPPPQEKATYTATMNYERSSQTIFGKQLTLFDLGGQTSFLDRFTGELAEFVFSNVKAFIFVVDITKFEEITRSKYYFDLCLKNLDKFSPQAYKYIFLHKTDLVKEDMIPEITRSMKSFLTSDYKKDVIYYPTSVFSNDIHRIMGEIYSRVSEIYGSLDPFIQNFIKENQDIVIEGQIFNLDGDNMTNLPFGKFSKNFSINNFLEQLNKMAGILSNSTNTLFKSILFEINNQVIITRVTNQGYVLIFVFNKNKMEENNESSAFVVSKIDAFEQQLSKITLIAQ